MHPNTAQMTLFFTFSFSPYSPYSPFFCRPQKPNSTRGTGLVHAVLDESSPIPLRKDGIRDSKLPCLMIIRTSGCPCGARDSGAMSREMERELQEGGETQIMADTDVPASFTSPGSFSMCISHPPGQLYPPLHVSIFVYQLLGACQAHQ